MLIDDIIEDTILDLQDIEQVKLKKAHLSFSNEDENNLNTLWMISIMRLDYFKQSMWIIRPRAIMCLKNFKWLDSGEKVLEDKWRDWNFDLPYQIIESLRVYKNKFEEFQSTNSGGSDNKLWNIYTVQGASLHNEAISEVTNEYCKTLQDFTYNFMTNEFS